MADLTTRAGKGSPLTNAEVDANFTNLNTDKVETGLAALDAYDTTIADTAVDVFVYDTSRDSDGGAWRHRTQHTSWYNETLNTATRGSRREFPAVAVIVAESNKVTIYDGDDPSLPMWMVFNQGSGQHLGGTSLVLTALVATNGGIYVTYKSGSDGYHQLNFLKDASFFHNTNGVAVRSLPILNRNEENASAVINTNGVLNAAHNDVAMTVLPNAPIDAATGLPVPTIACLVGESEVTMADGTTQRIDQVEVGSRVKTLEGEHEVLNWWDQGVKEVIELEFDGGQTLVCTADHKVRTTEGWVEAGDLTEAHEVIGL